MSDPRSSEKLTRISDGDQDVLAEKFNRVRARLRKMVQLRLDWRLQGRVDPSDVLQEAFIEISRRAPEQARRDDMPFLFWLRMQTWQKLLEIHRRHLGTQRRDATRDISIFEEYPEVNSRVLASHLKSIRKWTTRGCSRDTCWERRFDGPEVWMSSNIFHNSPATTVSKRRVKAMS
jgi:DNA-directed RNA polymerase specialized sigma24 family protein